MGGCLRPANSVVARDCNQSVPSVATFVSGNARDINMEDELQPGAVAGARLFVYGTLRKGFRSHELLQRFHARLIGRGSVSGRLYDLGEYPGALAGATDAERVYGEVYFLPRGEAAFRVLDRFESFDPARPESNEFERRETTVVLADGRKVRCWIYWMAGVRSAVRRIRAGNYAMCRK